MSVHEWQKSREDEGEEDQERVAPMTTARVLEFLQSTLEEQAGSYYDDEGTFGVRRVESFEDSGLLTSDRGVVVTFEGGAEFQITVVRSDRGRVDEED